MTTTRSLVLAVVVMGMTPAVARADRFIMAGLGYGSQAGFAGLSGNASVYGPRDGQEFDRIYMSTDMFATGQFEISFDFGMRVVSGFTLGMNAGWYPTQATGPMAPGTGERELAGMGVTAGWIFQSDRVLIHPTAFAQRAGYDPYYGGRVGLEVRANVRLLHVGSNSWLGGYALGGISTTTDLTHGDQKDTTTYSRTVGVAGVSVSF